MKTNGRTRKQTVTAAALVLGLGIVSAGSALAQDSSGESMEVSDADTVDTVDTVDDIWSQECDTAWNSSDASDYCTATISRESATSGGQCHVTSPSCRVRVSIIQTPDHSFPNTIANDVDDVTQSLSTTDDLKACLGPDGTSGDYAVIALRTSCESGETDAATAVSDGLPLLEQPYEDTGAANASW